MLKFHGTSSFIHCDCSLAGGRDGWWWKGSRIRGNGYFKGGKFVENVVNFGGCKSLGFTKGGLIGSEFANGFFHFISGGF